MSLSRRKLIEMLKDSRVDHPLADEVAENLAARLKSLAVSSSQMEEARQGRVGRKVLALIGSVGIFAWVGVTGVAASVGLVATGNMPAPIQNVVSSVLEVAGIQVPRADEDPVPGEVEQPSDGEADPELDITTTTLADESVVESGIDESPVPAETTIPQDQEDVTEQTPITVVKPVSNKPTTTPNKDQEDSNTGNGNSGNANNGNSGNANNGNSGNTSNGNSGNTNSGNAGSGSDQANSSNPGNSGEAGNANNGNAGQGNNGQGNGNAGSNAETVVTAPAVIAPLMPVNEPAKGNSSNQGNKSNQNKNKNK